MGYPETDSGPMATPTDETSRSGCVGTYGPGEIFRTELFPFPFFLVDVNVSPDTSITWQSYPWSFEPTLIVRQE